MVTVKDVARKANVSIATVSLVLNEKRGVRAETRARVLACIEELGYRPNMVARSFKTSSTKAIGVLVPTIINPVYPTIVHHLEQAARSEGYQVLLCSYGAHVATGGVDLLSDLHDRRVDGIITCGIPAMPAEASIGRLRRTMESFVARRTPFVFLSEGEQLERFVERLHVDRSRHGELFHLLSVDHVKAAYTAVSHLVRTGHRRIGLVAEDSRDIYPHNVPYLRKLEGFRRALEEQGIEPDMRLVVAARGDYLGGEQCFELLMQQPDPPTAVFCTGDIMALGVLRGARSHGRAVPAAFSVIGFDNIPLAAYWNPTLSTVAVPIPAMAQEAFRRLNRLMKGEEVLPSSMLFDVELVIRESCT